MQRIVGIGILAPAVFFLATGCASKNWVRELMEKRVAEVDQRVGGVEGRVGGVEGRVGGVEGRVGEVQGRVVEEAQRIDRVEGRVGEEAQRIEGVGSRVKTLETSVDEVGETAKAARERSEGALARAGEVDGRLTRLWANRHTRKLVETVTVHFGFNRWLLDDGGQTALMSVIKELRENPGLQVELEGYTDSVGARDYNIQLSQRRVEAVRRYLVENGIDLSRIHSIGRGPMVDRGTPEEKKRRVMVKLMIYPD